VSGFCDLTPPTCGPGCGVHAPAIVPSLSSFQFTFQGEALQLDPMKPNH
jgi:hypothetical protein